MKSIFDPSFKYTSSVETDLRKTFARVRREQLIWRKKASDKPTILDELQLLKGKGK